MTITPIVNVGMNRRGEWELAFPNNVSTAPAISNATYLSGLYCVAFLSSAEGIYRTHSSAMLQARVGLGVMITGVASGDTPVLLAFGNGGYATTALRIYYDPSSATWYVYSGATSLGSFVYFAHFKHWHYWGIDFKVDASNGWCSIYIDGIEVFNYAGKTDYGAADFDTLLIGPNSTTVNWKSLYVDDVYWDETTDELVPACPPRWLHTMLYPSGNGNYSQWAGSDGDSVNNYLLVDDGFSISIVNQATDYVVSSTPAEKDSYAINDTTGKIVTEPTEFVVSEYLSALEEAGTVLQLKMLMRYSGTDLNSAAFDVTTTNMPYMIEFAAPPGGGSWSKAILDALEVGIEIA